MVGEDNKQRFRAVVFDLDNTLIDFMKMKRISCEESISAMINAGLKINKEKGLRRLFSIYDKHGWEYSHIFQEFIKEITGKIDYRILAAGIVAYRRVRSGFLEPYPLVHSTLLKLKVRGIKLAILSDAPRLKVWIRLTSLKLQDYFDIVVTYDDTKKRKPAREPFLAVLKKLGLKPEEVLMVGDWPKRDIAGAKRVGMKTCLANYGRVKKDSRIKPDYSINQFDKIAKIVGVE